MPLRPLFGRLAGRSLPQSVRKPENQAKASRAAELNEATSQLWQAEATHSKVAFEAQVVPIYMALLSELKNNLPADEAEAAILELMRKTTAACHYRWSLRLPLKRPGSDYRKYEIIYTHALITAMAVESLRLLTVEDDFPLENLAARILSDDGVDRLRADPIVWEDWLGYFEKSETGGLYAASICDKHWLKPRLRATIPVDKERTNEPPIASQETDSSRGDSEQAETITETGSGRAVLAALREGLTDGSLSFNQPHDVVQVDRDGRTFLEYPAALRWCIERLELDEDLKRIKNRFDRLKVYKRTPEGRQLYRGKLRQRDPRVRGYVLEDHSVLWADPPPAGRFVIENLTTLD